MRGTLVSNQKQSIIRVVIEFVSQLLAMLSGEVYLRLKPYLVVQISSDIVTEHCCQVCVLSIMFCRSDCRLDMVSDCTIRETPRRTQTPPLSRREFAENHVVWRTRGLTELRQANVGYKQRVLMHGHQGWNVRHGLCQIYMRYVYIYELFIALFLLLFVHYCNLMVCVVFWVGKWQSRGSNKSYRHVW